MLFDNRKKKLFDDAYTEYISINKVIESIFNEAIANPFDDEPQSVTDIVCSLDLYLQGTLLEISLADDVITAEELEFIQSLPDAFEEVCARNRGYRRFLRTISPESYKEKAKLYFAADEIPLFLKLIHEECAGDIPSVIDSIEKILNAFAAIDDSFADEESRIITQTVSGLRSAFHVRTKTATQTKCVDSLGNPELGDEYELAMAELNDLIGLDAVKQEVTSQINLVKVNNMRKQRGLPELEVSCHMVFAGSPGTGKTTVARIIARIYKALGVVSKGHLVETDKSGLVAGYVGQTPMKTAQVIKKAKGGVLFIDEAYSLASEEGSNDFGKEAVATIVKGMEDYKDDLVVIVAGYASEMPKFINMNVGLASRFNKYINFADYSAEEMLEIFKDRCNKAQFILSQVAEKKALSYFKKHEGDTKFGNARGVRNYFERMVTKQATRIVSMPNPNEMEFRTILAEDVE